MTTLGQVASRATVSFFRRTLLSLGVPAQGIAITAGVNFSESASGPGKRSNNITPCGKTAPLMLEPICTKTLEPGCQVDVLRLPETTIRQPAGTFSTALPSAYVRRAVMKPAVRHELISVESIEMRADGWN